MPCVVVDGRPVNLAVARETASRGIAAVEDSRRPVAIQVTLVFLITLMVFAVTADYDQTQNDDIVATAVPVWNLVMHGSTDLSAYEGLSSWLIEVDGRVISNRWPGTMLIALVSYVVTAPFYRSIGIPVLWPGTIAAVIVCAAAVTVLFRLLWLMFGRRFALWAATVAGFGTGLWTVAAEGLWTHGPAALVSAAVLWALRARRQWWAGGFFGGLALIRPHLLIVAALVGYITARETKDVRALVRIGLPSAIGLALYVGYISWVVGEPTLGVGVYAFQQPQGWDRLLNVVGVTLAPRVGLLLYTPVVLCCLPMLPRAWGEAQVWERAAAFGGLTYLVVQLQMNNFFGGFGFYGYRIPLDGLIFALPLLCRSAKLFAESSTLRAVASSVLAVVSVWISAIGAIFYVGRSGHLDPWMTWGPAEALAGHSPWILSLVVAAGIGAVAWAVRSAYLRAETTRPSGDPAGPP